MKIFVVNYGAGNLQSIKVAFEKFNLTVIIEEPPFNSLDRSDAIILPGVGSFTPAMNSMKESLEKIKDEINSGKPILGICLGLQLFYSIGYERQPTEGMNLLTGSINKLQVEEKIPHIGWNTITITQQHNLMEGIPDRAHFYFVHSYVANPEAGDEVIAVTDYGKTFPTVIAKDNLFGTQFHPEKSSKMGLRLLQNFIEIVRR